MSSQLEEILSHIDDPTIRTKIRAEFEKTSKDFGLVFERHQQEGIRMPKAPVVLGSKVIVEVDDTFHHVVSLDDNLVTLVDTSGELRTVHVDGVTVAREFGDTMYPGLTPVDELRLGKPGDPVHTVINGENYHALEMLQYTHLGKVDVIYIDPPYNTGNKTWRYNDRYVSDKDSYRHSKWLSFMEKRLLIAKKLLSPTGVIIVAIDDNEHHRLRMLMDQVFGSGNFLADLVWDDKGSNLSKFTSGGVDYMLVFCKDVSMQTGFRDIKTHAPELVALGRLVVDGDVSVLQSQQQVRAYLKANKADLPKGVSAYSNVDAQGRVYCTTNMDNSLYRPNLRYAIEDPTTGRRFEPPANGWTVQPSTLATWLAENRVIFTATGPIKKVFLDEAMDALPSPVFYSPRIRSTKHLESVMGDKRFPFPKDHTVLMRWFRMVAPQNAVILDFFGGSGTTAEAVMRLNAEDGGTRQAILVTNNELSAADDKKLRDAGFGPGDAEYEALGVFNHVTKPRIKTVATGIREDGSTYSDGLAANVAFFNLEYLDRARVKYGHEFDSLAGLFWLRAGAVGPLVQRESLAQGYAVSEDASLAVLFRPGRASALAQVLASTPHSNLTHVFIVTDSDEQGNVAASYFSPTLTIERIYGSYLAEFQVNKKDA